MEWSKTEATQELVERLKVARQEKMEEWARQGFETVRSNDFALGGIATIDSIIEFIEECKNGQ